MEVREVESPLVLDDSLLRPDPDEDERLLGPDRVLAGMTFSSELNRSLARMILTF